jgi:hypothetical protein
VAKQGPGRCAWLPLHEALETFVRAASKTQGSEHIRSLHWYVASRLVGTWRPVSWSRVAFLQTASLPDLHLSSSPRRLQSASASIYSMIRLEEGLARELFSAG